MLIFYPSIKKEHVTRALNALRERGIEINKEDEEIIMASKVQIAQHNESGWVRVDSNFENSMGSSDGAEVCEVVGIMLLIRIYEDNEIADTAPVLYRDDLICSPKNNGFIRQICTLDTCLKSDHGN